MRTGYLIRAILILVVVVISLIELYFGRYGFVGIGMGLLLLWAWESLQEAFKDERRDSD